MFKVKCIKCGNKVSTFPKEIGGAFLVLFTIFYLVIFGLTMGSIIYSTMMVGVGTYWLITRPSKKYRCANCLNNTKTSYT